MKLERSAMKKWLNKENKVDKDTTEKSPKTSGTPKRGIEKITKLYKTNKLQIIYIYFFI